MSNSKQHGADFDTVIPGHQAMNPNGERRVDLDKNLSQPFLPRANLAVSAEAPNGTTAKGWAAKNRSKTVLEQHVAFFDQDADGVIWPGDTFRGFRQLGYHFVWCLLSVWIIHSGFSWCSQDSWVPDPFFRIRVRNIHRTKHGSDTGTYDAEGRFVPAKFEAIFAKNDADRKGGLTFKEGLRMIHGQRQIMDPIGWIAAFFEWFETYLLFWPADGVVTKEQMRTVYDGSVFFDIAEREKSRSQTAFSGVGVKKHN